MFEIHKSKRWDAYDKNCSFYEHTKLSFFTFKIGYETGTEFIVLWCQFVCLGLLTPCYWGDSSSEVRKMSSDPAWISFTNLLRGSDKEIRYDGR